MAFQALKPSVEDRRSQRRHAGLCADCLHLQLLRSKTSLFVRCGLSDQDERFARYPQLPIRSCPGFRPISEPSESDGLSDDPPRHPRPDHGR